MESKKETWFEKGWQVLNDSESRYYTIFHTCINLLILISIGVVFYEVAAKPLPGQLVSPAKTKFLVITGKIDHFILYIFVAEYIARLFFIRNPVPAGLDLSLFQKARYHLFARIRYIFSPWGLIDLSALLPIFPLLRSLRMLRLLRLFRSAQFFRYHNPFTILAASFRDNALLFAVSLSLVFVVTGLSSVMLYVAEYGENKQITSFEDTVWWAIVTVTTVGYGDISPTTTGGKVIAAGLMFAGMFVIAMFAGLVSSTLVGRLMPLRAEQVRMSSITDHIVIAGWNLEVPMMLEELEREYGNTMPRVIVIADRERPTSLDSKYIFVKGEPTKESELDKARVPFARTIVVVADYESGSPPATRDAVTVLTVFTIRSFEKTQKEKRQKAIHIVVEILDRENYEHAQVAGADEVIETSRLGSSLLAHTAGNPGIGMVMSELLLATGSNLYTDRIPKKMCSEEMDFGEIRKSLRGEFDVLVIGFVHQGKLNLNPADEDRLTENDKLVYIGSRRTLGSI